MYPIILLFQLLELGTFQDDPVSDRAIFFCRVQVHSEGNRIILHFQVLSRD